MSIQRDRILTLRHSSMSSEYYLGQIAGHGQYMTVKIWNGCGDLLPAAFPAGIQVGVLCILIFEGLVEPNVGSQHQETFRVAQGYNSDMKSAYLLW